MGFPVPALSRRNPGSCIACEKWEFVGQESLGRAVKMEGAQKWWGGEGDKG